PLMALLSLIIIYYIGLELGLSRGFSMAGSLLLGINATFVLMSLWPMSDVVATCWSLVAIWGSLRSRRHNRWALLAGVAFGMAFLVRPTSVLLVVPILLSIRLAPRTLLYFLLGGLPLAVIFLAYNNEAYGNPLLMGHAVTGHQHELRLTGFTTRFNHYLYWVSMTMSPLLPLGWLLVAANGKVHWRIRAMLITWFGLFLIFYSCYTHYNYWWYTRFLLPGYPAVILGALLTARDIVEWVKKATAQRRQPWVRRLATAALLVMVLGFERHYDQQLHVLKTGQLESMHLISCQL